MATNGCFTFGLSLTDAAAAALDVGLRFFTAPPGGGYAATTRYPVFELASVSGGAPLAATLDPLAPLDESRAASPSRTRERRCHPPTARRSAAH